MSTDSSKYIQPTSSGETADDKEKKHLLHVLQDIGKKSKHSEKLITNIMEAAGNGNPAVDEFQKILQASQKLSSYANDDHPKLIEKKEGLTHKTLSPIRHDLRSQVGIITGYSEIIIEEFCKESAFLHVTVEKKLKYLIKLSNDILPIIDTLQPPNKFFTDESFSTELSAQEDIEVYDSSYADCHILIVDDSEFHRDLLSRRLLRAGLQVKIAHDGEEGLKITQNEPVDLILLDIMMPKINGFEVLEKLKKSPETKDIPVLMISSISNLESIVRCIQIGADDYLPTPINPTLLHARIRACLDKKILRDQDQRHVEQLHQTQQLLETAIESMDNGFVLLDSKKKILKYNKRYEDLYPTIKNLPESDRSLEKLLRENIKNNLYHRERRTSVKKEEKLQYCDQWVDNHLQKFSSQEPFLERFHNHQWIEVVCHKMPDGGTVCLHKDVTTRKRNEEHLNFLAHHDALTGLPNRGSLEAHLRQHLEIAKAEDISFAVMFLDLDGFKEVNDTQGHDCGDALLKFISEQLKSALRQEDVIGRIGGDEFAIVLNETKGNHTITHLAERLLQTTSLSFTWEGEPVFYGVSIGIARFPEDGQTGEELLAYADEAMYTAKKSGKGQYRFFSQNPNVTPPDTTS